LCGVRERKIIHEDFTWIAGRFAMSGYFVVKPLDPDGIPQAFAVVSIFDNRLSKDAWCEYAAAIVKKPGNGVGRGIMTVQSEEGYIYGLSVHHLKNELRRGRVLEIENFAIADLVGAKTAAGLLLEYLESIARAQQCRCMSLRLLNPKMRKTFRRSNGPSADLFEAAGFRSEPLRLRKCFEEGG
jgi:hypothetical protein